MKLFAMLLTLLLAAPALAHEAPLDQYGCHSNKLKFGNTTSRECHVGLLVNRIFTSVNAEYQAYIAEQALIIEQIKIDLAAIKAKLLATALGQLTLTWDANTEANLAGYRGYCGKASRNYTMSKELGKVTQVQFTELAAGEYFCAVTAVNTAGLESDYSNEVRKVLP